MRVARIAAAVVGAVVVLSLAMMAIAHHSSIVDANDTRGLMDVRRVDTNGMRAPKWTVVTFPTWRAADIFDAGFVVVRLDTFGGPRFDHFVLVRSDGRRLRASLWRDRAEKSDYRIRTLRVRRPDQRSLTVRVPLDDLRIGTLRVSFDWIVETVFLGERCPRACLDNVPDQGRVTEPVPVPTPTITPTPTPTED